VPRTGLGELCNSINGGLFSKALMESGFPAAQSLSAALNRTKWISLLLACPPWTPTKACLRDRTVEELLWAQSEAMAGDLLSTGALESWFPVVDGVEILEYPMTSALAGRFNPDIPLLIGSNTDEGSLFVKMGHIYGVFGKAGFDALANDTLNAAAGFPKTNATMLARAEALYAPGILNNAGKNAHFLTDFTFACGSRAVARSISEKGGSAFLYHFDYRPACDDVPVKGVYHSAELKFVFDSPVVGNYVIPRYNWTSGHWDKQCDFNTKAC